MRGVQIQSKKVLFFRGDTVRSELKKIHPKPDELPALRGENRDGKGRNKPRTMKRKDSRRSKMKQKLNFTFKSEKTYG